MALRHAGDEGREAERQRRRSETPGVPAAAICSGASPILLDSSSPGRRRLRLAGGVGACGMGQAAAGFFL